MSSPIKRYKVKGNTGFGVLEYPFNSKHHYNNEYGYIKLVNFETGEICIKKVYNNTKGLHFKHSPSGWGSQKAAKGTHYISDMNATYIYVPFQVIEDNNGL